MLKKIDVEDEEFYKELEKRFEKDKFSKGPSEDLVDETAPPINQNYVLFSAEEPSPTDKEYIDTICILNVLSNYDGFKEWFQSANIDINDFVNNLISHKKSMRSKDVKNAKLYNENVFQSIMKIYGVFGDKDQAKKWYDENIKEYSEEKKIDVSMGVCGRWTPIFKDEFNTFDSHYTNDRLNKLMQKWKENQKLQKEVFKKTKKEKIEKMEENPDVEALGEIEGLSSNPEKEMQ